jgi:hypothetical protein
VTTSSTFIWSVQDVKHKGKHFILCSGDGEFVDIFDLSNVLQNKTLESSDIFVKKKLADRIIFSAVSSF